MSDASPIEEALWRLPVVVERTGLQRDTIYAMERAGAFPQRRQIGERAVAWLASEVVAWMRSKPTVGTSGVSPNPKAGKNKAESNTIAA